MAIQTEGRLQKRYSKNIIQNMGSHDASIQLIPNIETERHEAKYTNVKYEYASPTILRPRHALDTTQLANSTEKKKVLVHSGISN